MGKLIAVACGVGFIFLGRWYTAPKVIAELQPDDDQAKQPIEALSKTK